MSSFCSIFHFFWLIVAISKTQTSTNTIFRYTVGSVIPKASNQNKHVRAASAACCSKAGGQQVHCPRLLPALTHDDCRSTSTRHPDESTVGPMVHAYRATDAPRTDGADIPHRIAKNPLPDKYCGSSYVSDANGAPVTTLWGWGHPSSVSSSWHLGSLSRYSWITPCHHRSDEAVA